MSAVTITIEKIRFDILHAVPIWEVWLNSFSLQQQVHSQFWNDLHFINLKMSSSAWKDINIGQTIEECKDMFRSTLIQIKKAFDVDTAIGLSDVFMREQVQNICTHFYSSAQTRFWLLILRSNAVWIKYTMNCVSNRSPGPLIFQMMFPNYCHHMMNSISNVNHRIKIKSENKSIVIIDSDNESIVEVEMRHNLEVSGVQTMETAHATCNMQIPIYTEFPNKHSWKRL